MRISFRLNEEYDAELISKLSKYKKDNLSKQLRKILRIYFLHKASDKMADNQSDINKTIKWSFPNEKENPK